MTEDEKKKKFGCIKELLDSGYDKVEYLSDKRVTNLISILNNYDNFIDNFESIELENNSNCLDTKRYLISPDLHNLLVNGYKTPVSRDIRKDDEGVYMVVFKLLNKKSNTLIYKYIKYPTIFKDCLFSYIVNESSSLVIGNSNSVGSDYLFIIDNSFDVDSLVKDRIEQAMGYFMRAYLEGNSRGIFPRNVVDLYKFLLQGCPL